MLATCRPLLFFACALLGCASQPPPAAPATVPHEAPPTPSPFAAASHDAHGTLLGPDGAPMRQSEVQIGDRVVPVDATGAYRITAPGPGFYKIRFSGVNYMAREIGALFDGHDQQIDVKLGTYAYLPSFADVGVVVITRDKDGKPGRPGGKTLMRQQPDGAFAAEIQVQGDELLYELVNVVDGRMINGTLADGFENDGFGDYASRLRVQGGKVTVRFDPSKLPPKSGPGSARFADPASASARVAALEEAVQRHYEELYRALSAMTDSAERKALMKARKLPVDTAYRAEIRRALKDERDPSVRVALLLTYLSPPDTLDPRSDEAQSMAAALLDALRPDAPPFWAFDPIAMLNGVEIAGHRPEHQWILDRLIASAPSRDRAASLILSRFSSAKQLEEPELAAFYTQVLKDKLSDTFAMRAMERMNVERKVVPGTELPDFDLAAFTQDANDHSAPKGGHYRRSTFQGKVVLIDLWATWCAPCMAEMKHLQEVYERHGKDGRFTILSVASNDEAEAVREFRRHTWKMPWHHAVLKGDESRTLLKLFEADGIPHPILVDGKGKILALGESLLGPSLEKTVTDALSKANK